MSTITYTDVSSGDVHSGESFHLTAVLLRTAEVRRHHGDELPAFATTDVAAHMHEVPTVADVTATVGTPLPFELGGEPLPEGFSLYLLEKGVGVYWLSELG